MDATPSETPPALKSNSANKTTNVILIIIVSLLLILTGYIGYRCIALEIQNRSKSTEKSQESGNSTNDKSSDGANKENGSDVVAPEGWSKLLSSGNGYSIYRPNGWYYRYFGSNAYVLGLDPNPIPETSTSASIVTFYVSLKDLDSTIENYTNWIVNTSESQKTVNSREWTIIEGESDPEGSLSGQQVVQAYYEINNKTYMLEYAEEETSFDDYLVTYYQILATIDFTD